MQRLERFSKCLLKLHFVSNSTPNIVGFVVYSIVWLFILSLRLISRSEFFNVNIDCWHFFLFIFRPILLKNFDILFIPISSCFLMCLKRLCVIQIVRSSANMQNLSLVLLKTFQMSFMNSENRSGDSGLPCGTPFDMLENFDR